MLDPTDIRVLLLEDSDADAHVVRDLMSGRSSPTVSVERASTLRDAKAALARPADTSPDVVVADLSLPDSAPRDTLAWCATVSRKMPVVVLTGDTGGMQSGVDAVAVGVHEFVLKDDLTADRLVRSVLFAIERSRIVGQTVTTRTDRSASAGSPETGRRLPSTRAALGLRELRQTDPERFESAVRRYSTVLSTVFSSPMTGVDPAEVRAQVEAVADLLADRAAGARDVLAVHLEAMDRLQDDDDTGRTAALLRESHYTLVQLFSHVLTVYRGYRLLAGSAGGRAAAAPPD